MTRTPLSRSKGQRSRSPGRFTHRGVNVSGSCNGERGNVLTMGTYCYIVVCTLQVRSARRREALRRPQREERGGGILWWLPAYTLLNYDMRYQWKVELDLWYIQCNNMLRQCMVQQGHVLIDNKKLSWSWEACATRYHPEEGKVSATGWRLAAVPPYRMRRE